MYVYVHTCICNIYVLLFTVKRAFKRLNTADILRAFLRVNVSACRYMRMHTHHVIRIYAYTNVSYRNAYTNVLIFSFMYLHTHLHLQTAHVTIVYVQVIAE